MHTSPIMYYSKGIGRYEEKSDPKPDFKHTIDCGILGLSSDFSTKLENGTTAKVGISQVIQMNKWISCNNRL